MNSRYKHISYTQAHNLFVFSCFRMINSVLSFTHAEHDTKTAMKMRGRKNTLLC